MTSIETTTVPGRKYLFLTVFIAGMSTLAVEFTTSRMLQTVCGTSNLVWANVIGLVLLFLTAGYFIGGWLADRYPSPKVFYGLVTFAGFCSVFFLLLTSVLLRASASSTVPAVLNAVLTRSEGSPLPTMMMSQVSAAVHMK